MDNKRSPFDKPLARVTGADLGLPHRKMARMAARDSRLFGEHTASKINRGLRLTARAVVAGVLASLMAIGLIVLGMCFVLGLGYTLSLPLIGALGVGAVLTIGAVMLRAANRLAFMNKVDVFLQYFGLGKTSSEKHRDNTQLIVHVDPAALPIAPAPMVLTPQQDRRRSQGDAQPVAPAESLRQTACRI